MTWPVARPYTLGKQIEPGELIAVWSGRIVTADELDELPREIRRHTVQVEERLYLASLSPDEPPDFINHSCEPNAGLDGQITIVAMHASGPAKRSPSTTPCATARLTTSSNAPAACPLAAGRVTGQRLAHPPTVGALCRTFLALSRAPHQGAQAAALPAEAESSLPSARRPRAIPHESGLISIDIKEPNDADGQHLCCAERHRRPRRFCR